VAVHESQDDAQYKLQDCTMYIGAVERPECTIDLRGIRVV